MQFLYPEYLWALLALSIPIIIHLFQFRKFKKIYFSNIQFLEEVKEVRARRNKLKHLLVLLSRLLALMFLIFAFAQPFFNKDSSTHLGLEYVSIFLDNSYSMEAEADSESLLNRAKQFGIDRIRSNPDNVKYRVQDYRLLGSNQRWLSAEDAINHINTIQYTRINQTFESVLEKLMRQELPQIEIQELWITNDGQKINFEHIPSLVDSSVRAEIILFHGTQQPNIFIDSAWFEEAVLFPNKIHRLIIRLQNHSQFPAENVRIAVHQSDQTKPGGFVNLVAMESRFDTIALSWEDLGWQSVAIEIEDFPIEFDNNFFLSFRSLDRVKALYIGKKHYSYFKAAISGTTFAGMDQARVDKLRYDRFAQYSLIILDDVESLSSGFQQALVQFSEDGGNLLIFPPSQGDLADINQLLDQLQVYTYGRNHLGDMAVGYTNNRSFEFRDVFKPDQREKAFPTVNLHYAVQGRSNQIVETLMKFRNNSPFLLSFSNLNSKIYLCTSPSDLRHSDFLSKGSFFVPLLNKMLISNKLAPPLYHSVEKNEYIELPRTNYGQDPVFRFRSATSAFEFIPGWTTESGRYLLNTQDQIQEAGHYHLIFRDSIIQSLGFNYNRRESRLDFYTESELENLLPANFSLESIATRMQLERAMAAQHPRKPLWYWCIIFVLIFVVLEQILIRHFRSA